MRVGAFVAHGAPRSGCARPRACVDQAIPGRVRLISVAEGGGDGHMRRSAPTSNPLAVCLRFQAQNHRNRKPLETSMFPRAWVGCGGRIRTCDLQVMSLTSYRTAPPRDDDSPDATVRRMTLSFDAFRRPGNDLFSHTLRCSTIGAGGLHFRVRDGIGCFSPAMATRSSERAAEVSTSCVGLAAAHTGARSSRSSD